MSNQRIYTFKDGKSFLSVENGYLTSDSIKVLESKHGKLVSVKYKGKIVLAV